MNRGFAIAFSISLGVHLSLLVARLPQWGWLQTQKEQPPLEVIYEYELAKEDLRQLEARLAKAKREALTAPALTVGVQQPLIRIPDRPLMSPQQTLPDLFRGRSAIVDLTNLVEAAQGNPVLLSYFSAIREQIQDTANRRTWMTGEGRGGIVYVSFVLKSAGHVHSVAIMEDRSSSSQTLRNIAAKIVKSSAPFPPFPPSLRERRKTIIVPLEFLLRSS